ncbi:transmembrane 4 L6 family member 4 isoform X3 [Hippoglossus hippoglossus]|uniref:transmembrane 4 L6 family member 4 isoform X3 n=1 Tax=Hippoglossus hippoglossus TaxID=8267 RepID=UPI00148CC634|nr:transmembrane 4 L6 family member 4 isoform X3 [Hippoglossus hippoglossus]
MCSGSFAKCLGITLIPLAIACVLCNILLFFPSGESVDRDNITEEVWYFGGILGSGVLMIFPALVFLGLKNNDCCGCCGNESCGRSFAMLSSMLFAAVGVLGAGYSVIVSSVALSHGPKCGTATNVTNWVYPFSNGAGRRGVLASVPVLRAAGHGSNPGGAVWRAGAERPAGSSVWGLWLLRRE